MNLFFFRAKILARGSPQHITIHLTHPLSTLLIQRNPHITTHSTHPAQSALPTHTPQSTHLPSAPTTPIVPRRTKRSRQSRTADRAGKKTRNASRLTPQLELQPPIGFGDLSTGNETERQADLEEDASAHAQAVASEEIQSALDRAEEEVFSNSESEADSACSNHYLLLPQRFELKKQVEVDPFMLIPTIRMMFHIYLSSAHDSRHEVG